VIDFTFEALVAPTGTDEFFARHWEREPLPVRRGDPGHYRRLLTLDDLDRLLAEGGLQHPAVRLVRGGAQVPVRAYTRDLPWGGASFARAVVVESVLAAHRDGATVVFQALHRNHAPLARLCRALEGRFAHRFQTNVYLTPPGERGLGVHFDRHDVFVLQVHGTKRWTVYPEAAELPSRGGAYDFDPGDPGEPLFEVTLEAGDLLYLPRGYPHQAAARDDTSVHVALGVVTTTWADVFARALAMAGDDPELRRSLPAGALLDPARWPELEGEFRRLVGRFAEGAELAPVLDRLAATFASGRLPLARGRLAARDRAGWVELDTVLCRAPTVVAYLRGPAAGEATGDGGGAGRRDGSVQLVQLVFQGKRVTLPAAAGPAVAHMQSGRPFRVAELPGAIDDASRRVVARRLVREGYLVRAEAGGAEEAAGGAPV